MESPLLDKSLEFASQVVLFYEEFSKSRKDTTIAKQLLRSATSIGANINEAVYGSSKADFIAKLHISLKETNAKALLTTCGQQKRIVICEAGSESPPRAFYRYMISFSTTSLTRLQIP